MRAHRFLLSSEPAKRGPTSPRCYDRGSACHAPQGAAARCCSVVALGRAWKERLWFVAPIFFGHVVMSQEAAHAGKPSMGYYLAAFKLETREAFVGSRRNVAGFGPS